MCRAFKRLCLDSEPYQYLLRISPFGRHLNADSGSYIPLCYVIVAVAAPRESWMILGLTDSR